jgi:hypothetical protein
MTLRKIATWDIEFTEAGKVLEVGHPLLLNFTWDWVIPVNFGLPEVLEQDFGPD